MNWPSTFAINLCCCFLWLISIFLDLSSAICFCIVGQFRALADQLFRNPDYHKHVRKEIFKQLKHFRKLYEGYVPMNYKGYLRKMKKSGEWGDHVTLQAAADRFQAKICLVTSFRDTCYVEIIPKDKNPTRELWLSFWSEVHYNSLYATGDVPTRKPRKKYWLF
ncbi:OVARIAN TUMOR DOMAIN-containing deubiquitinating enzyme 11 [Citrus sinensis]|nr:OVARIAN TUMOR DOMAIN-containing deubiquitinating enzyme 11 [Citrus sinensis]